MRALRRRRRWGRRHGRIRVREDVPMEERRAKVARPKGAFFFSFREERFFITAFFSLR